MATKHYYKQKLENQNLSVEYSSEDDEITIMFRHKLGTGAMIHLDQMRFHPSYAEPLIELLKELTKGIDLLTEGSKPSAGHEEAQG